MHAVVFGLVNAGWELAHVRHAFVTNTAKGSPGAWVATDRKNRDVVKESYCRAREVVPQRRADPARSADPHVLETVDIVCRLLGEAFLGAHPVGTAAGELVPAGGKSAVPARRTAFAFLDHIRAVASKVTVNDAGLRITVSASARDVAERANAASSDVSNHLRRFAEEQRFMKVHDKGSDPTDAFTYQVFLPRHLESAARAARRGGEVPQGVSTAMGGVLPINRPDLTIAAHDFCGRPVNHDGHAAGGIGGTAGFILAVIAENPGISQARLATACGVTERAIREGLTKITAATGDGKAARDPLVEYDRDLGWQIAVNSREALIAEMDQRTLSSQTANRSARREARHAEEREAFALHVRHRKHKPVGTKIDLAEEEATWVSTAASEFLAEAIRPFKLQVHAPEVESHQPPGPHP